MTPAELCALLDDDSGLLQHPHAEIPEINSALAHSLFRAVAWRDSSPALQAPSHQMPVLP